MRLGVTRLKSSRFRMLVGATALALAFLHGETASAAGSSQEAPASSSAPSPAQLANSRILGSSAAAIAAAAAKQSRWRRAAILCQRNVGEQSD